MSEVSEGLTVLLKNAKGQPKAGESRAPLTGYNGATLADWQKYGTLAGKTKHPIFQNSCSRGTCFLLGLHSGQETVCPPNADSSPGRVPLNHDTQRQTSRHKPVYAGEGGVMMMPGTNGTMPHAAQRATKQRLV